jgi:hypothetical protein
MAAPARRLSEHVRRPPAVAIEVDGAPVTAFPGESLAAALLAAGRRTFRRARDGTPRGPFCNMGICFDCAVEVDGVAGVRACMTAVRAGMTVRTDAR